MADEVRRTGTALETEDGTPLPGEALPAHLHDAADIVGLGGGGGPVAAADVSYAGSAGLSATDVEAALDELDADKAPAAHPHADYADVDGEYAVNTVAASGATETLTLAPAHRVTMDQNCTFTFPTPTAGHTFLLWLSGAFTPTFPASVDWNAGAAPTYASPSLYGFTTLDGGTTWAGTLIASGLA